MGVCVGVCLCVGVWVCFVPYRMWKANRYNFRFFPSMVAVDLLLLLLLFLVCYWHCKGRNLFINIFDPEIETSKKKNTKS